MLQQDLLSADPEFVLWVCLCSMSGVFLSAVSFSSNFLKLFSLDTGACILCELTVFQMLCIKCFWNQSSSVSSTALGKTLSLEGSPLIALFLLLHFFQVCYSGEENCRTGPSLQIAGSPPGNARSSPKEQERQSNGDVFPHVSGSPWSCSPGVIPWLLAENWMSSAGLKMAPVAILCLVQYSSIHMLMHTHIRIYNQTVPVPDSFCGSFPYSKVDNHILHFFFLCLFYYFFFFKYEMLHSFAPKIHCVSKRWIQFRSIVISNWVHIFETSYSVFFIPICIKHTWWRNLEELEIHIL